MDNNIPIQKTHSYSVSVAMDVGINAAVVFQNICYWVEINRANNRNFADGSYWTYNTVKAFTNLFPEMTYEQIRNALRKLENANYIKSACFNNDGMNRTKWYTVVDADTWIGKAENQQTSSDEPIVNETKSICENSQMELGKIPNANSNIYNTESSTNNKQTNNNNTNNSHQIKTIYDGRDKDHHSSEVTDGRGNAPIKPLRQKPKSRRESFNEVLTNQNKMLDRVQELCLEDFGLDDETTERTHDIFAYFIDAYRETKGRIHPKMSDDTLKNIISQLNSGLEDYIQGSYTGDHVADDTETAYALIDLYMQADIGKFNGVNCDHHMPFFARNDTLVCLLYQLLEGRE